MNRLITMAPEEVMLFWFTIGVPITILIIFLLIRKRIAPWLGLGNLRRYKKEGYIGGIAEMIANLIYNKPSSYRLLQIRFLVLAIIILAPEGAGLFMYLFLWAIIPKESDKERQERNDRHKKMRKLSKDLANVYQARNSENSALRGWTPTMPKFFSREHEKTKVGLGQDSDSAS